ncbi:MAG TPA: ABC transporter ATP-binding protein [Ruminiclostridium sp.]|nr:ABC transporter ATP-binding protein [Ruminiclostridium sp.]
MEYIIEMQNVRKTFTGIVANDDINLQVEKGSIHALLGENGAGKSTLMSILFGLYQPDSGYIRVRGKEVRIANPNTATELGIGMVHQHFKLVHNFTVIENIILGSEKTRNLVVDINTARRRIVELSERYKLCVDPDSRIEDITVGMQQRVEILKMLYRDAEILIFDEPTAVLTPQEIEELMHIMRNMTAEGKTILLITHKLREIKAVAGRCTVIRRGRVVETVDVAQTSEDRLAELMVGRKVSFRTDKPEAVLGEDILMVKNLCMKDHRGLDAVKNVSFSAKRGEILGIAGVEGNGQAQLVEAITGLDKIESGSIEFKGIDISNKSIRFRNELGMGFIPEDRQTHGLVLDFTLEDNFILKNYYKKPFSQKGILDRNSIRNYAAGLIEQFDVRSGQGRLTQARSMSGGNQQKAIIAREVSETPDLLVVVQPTRGLDVGAIEYIHSRIIDERNKGKTVLLFSLDLDEILNLSDRIAVMYEGKILNVVKASETDENQLGLLMGGSMETEVLQ